MEGDTFLVDWIGVKGRREGYDSGRRQRVGRQCAFGKDGLRTRPVEIHNRPFGPLEVLSVSVSLVWAKQIELTRQHV